MFIEVQTEKEGVHRGTLFMFNESLILAVKVYPEENDVRVEYGSQQYTVFSGKDADAFLKAFRTRKVY